MRKTDPRSGFTLIELTIVAAIAAIISLAVMAAFASGINIFSRIETSTSVKAGVLLALERIERDIRNSFSYKDIGFTGEAGKIVFPGMVRRSGEKGRLEESLGAVSYYVADNEKIPTLFREERPYPLAVKGGSANKGTAAAIIPVEYIRFSYYKYDKESRTYSWAEYWDTSKDKPDDQSGTEIKKPLISSIGDMEEKLPLAVKIEISYNDGGRARSLGRSVFLEQAVSLRLAKRKAEDKNK